MGNYVDIKRAYWKRIYFSDNADMEKIADFIKRQEWGSVFTSDSEYEDSEILYDTEETIHPNQNNGEATIEVFADDTLIQKNTD